MNLEEAKEFDGLEVRDAHARYGQLDPSIAWRFLDHAELEAARDRRHLDSARSVLLGPNVARRLAFGAGALRLDGVRALWIESAMVPVDALCPELESLVFESLDDGAALDRSLATAPLRAPRLRSLVIDTWGLTRSTLQWLFAAEAPSLESLHLGLGAVEYGADHAVNDLFPLLSGQLFLSLKELGLHFADVARLHGDLLFELSRAPLVRRLQTLDLSACWFEGTQSELDPDWVATVDVQWDSEWIGPGNRARYVPTME